MTQASFLPTLLHNGTHTSRDAALLMVPHKANLRERIYHELACRGEYGATELELSQTLHIKRATTCPRLWELQADGAIEDSGARRPTEGKFTAKVWRVRTR